MYQAHKLEALQQLAILVLEAVCLIDDNTAPVYGVKFRTTSQDHLKSGDKSLKLVGPSHRTALQIKGETWENI